MSGSTRASRGCSGRRATSATSRSREVAGDDVSRGRSDEVAGSRRRNGAPAGDDEAGARLIALNMALSGTPREETARYLADHFSLADADALLDDVYERADR